MSRPFNAFPYLGIVVALLIVGGAFLLLQETSPIAGGGAGSALVITYEDGKTSTYEGVASRWLNLVPQTITSTVMSSTPVVKVASQSRYSLKLGGDANQIQEWSIVGTQTVSFDDGTVNTENIDLGSNKGNVLDLTSMGSTVVSKEYTATAIEGHSKGIEGRHHMKIYTAMTVTVKWKDGTTSTKSSSNEVDWQYDYKKTGTTTTTNDITSFKVTSSGNTTWQ